MQEESQFSIQLRKYIKMIITIWPSLRPGLRNIADITAPHEQSMLPNKSYNTMTQQQFINTLINDLHLFIMEHDVKQEDLEDYLYDILDLLSIDEQITSVNSNIGGIKYMSQQLIKIITQLQDGKTQTIDKFQKNIYQPVIQMGVGDAIEQGGNSQSGSDDQQEMDQEDDNDDDYEDIEEDQEGEQLQQGQQKMKEQNNQQKQQKQQNEKQLEDDGWVVVKKKSNNKKH